MEKILSFLTPKCTKDVAKFLGLVNYFGRFIKGFSDKIEFLNKLKHTKGAFSWPKEAEIKFNQLIKVLTTEPVVQPYSFQKVCTLTTDASENSVGAVLTQEGKPVAYISKQLSPAERRWSNIEREGSICNYLGYQTIT